MPPVFTRQEGGHHYIAAHSHPTTGPPNPPAPGRAHHPSMTSTQWPYETTARRRHALCPSVPSPEGVPTSRMLLQHETGGET